MYLVRILCREVMQFFGNSLEKLMGLEFLSISSVQRVYMLLILLNFVLDRHFSHIIRVSSPVFDKQRL
jgi:hypothetical protein